MATRKPSVLFINRVYPPVRGASGRVLRDLAQAFAADGWDVTVATTGPAAACETDGPVRVVRVKAPIRRKSVLPYLRAWIGLFRTGLFAPPCDLIVTMTDPPLLVTAGQALARLKGARHIHWCQDLYPDILPALGIRMKESRMRLFRTLSRRAMKKCDKVVTVGRCMARQLTHGGVDPGRVAVIPNWPDAELQGPAVPPQRALMRAKGARAFDKLLTDGTVQKFRVLYSGTLGRAHPVDTILDAAALLDREHPEIEFAFVGDGPAFDRLALERARRGLENIRLLPYQPASRLRGLMESGDVHLITMKHESAGMLVPSKLYAAMAVGRPCILVGPENSEIARVLHDFGAGIVVPQGNAQRLTAAILRLRMNSEDWFRAHEGAARAGEIFVPEQSMDAWLKRARDVVATALQRAA